jgi:hypothetical protein
MPVLEAIHAPPYNVQCTHFYPLFRLCLRYQNHYLSTEVNIKHRREAKYISQLEGDGTRNMQSYGDFLMSCSLQIKNNVHEIISSLYGIISKSCGTSKIILCGSCRRFK